MPGRINNTPSPKLQAPLEVRIEFDDITNDAPPSVSLTHDLKELLFSDFTKKDKFISLKPLGSNVFSKFIIYEVSDRFLEGSNKIMLNDIPRFNRLDSDITVDRALITKIEPVQITEAVIMFNEELYPLLKKLSGSDLFQMLKKLGLNVIHQGDDIFGSSGKILLCEPVDQGILTDESTITLVKDSYNELSITKQVESLDILDVSNYLSLTNKKETHDFNVAPFDEFTLKSIKSLKDNYDTENLAFATTSDLSKIGALSENYVELTIDETNKKIVKLISFVEPNNYKTNTIYLSPIFIINNGSPSHVQIKSTDLKLSSIPIADKITINKVSSFEAAHRPYQQPSLTNLKSYFEEKQRIVSLGDLIPITFDSVLARTVLQTNPELSFPVGTPDSIIWFKITSIVHGEKDQESNSPQFLVDPTHTGISTNGELLKSSLPPLKTDWYNYLGLPKTFDYLEGKETVFPYAKTLAKFGKSTITNKSLRTTVLLQSLNRNVGKSFIVENLARSLGLHIVVIDGFEYLNPASDSKTIGLIRGRLDKVTESTEGLIVFLKHIEALAFKQDQQAGAKPSLMASKLVELIDDYTSNGVIFVASTNEADKIPEEVRSKFRFEIEVPVPSEEERKRIFQYLIDENEDYELRSDVSLGSLSLQSAGLTPRDLKSIVENAQALSLERLEDLAEELSVDITTLINNNPITLIPQDFEKSINSARNKFSDSIGAPRIPNVTWDDIGGLDLVKDEILDTIDMPLKHPELFSNGVKKRSGILFYGPPGTGKTLLAKAIATNFSLNFFSVKGPELLNMYIGESEANVRKVFQRARDAKPCVVFFDELDSVAPKRGNQGDSGGVMDRIVSQLLAELDGMSGGDAGDGVFVVGATNRPDLLDEALLRPGRFDKMLYLGISDTNEKQQNILTALTRKFKLDPDVDLKKLAESCPFNFTGADFYALCSDSMLNAMTRVANEIDMKIAKYNADKENAVSTRWYFDNVATKEDITVLVKAEDFDKARKELSPSVSAEELEHYLRVRENFEGGKTKS